MTDGKSDDRHHPRPSAEEPIEGLPPGFGDGIAGKVAFCIAVAFSAFQLYVAAYGNLPSQVMRAMHVAFLLLLGFGADRQSARPQRRRPAPGSGRSASLGFLTGLYNWVFYADLIRRSGFLTTPDLIVGAVLIVLVFEGARQLMGLPLTIMCGALPRLLLPRPVSAAAVDPSRLRFRADRRLFRLRNGGHLRHPGLCVGRLYLHLRGVRRLSRTRRHDRAVQRRRARPGRLTGAAARRRSACCRRR